MRYRTNLRELHELDQALCWSKTEINPATGKREFKNGIEPYAAVVTGHSEEDCNGPHYTMQHGWAAAAIRDRVYHPRSEPLVNWRFNVIGRPGVHMVVTPIYEPFAEYLQKHKNSDLRVFSEQTAVELQEWQHGTSNWCATSNYLLRVLFPERNRTMRGFIRAFDYAYVYLPDIALAQDVLDSLWAATEGDARAFAGSESCAFCSRPLKDPLSSARGYGPDCAEHYGMPRLPPEPSS